MKSKRVNAHLIGGEREYKYNGYTISFVPEEKVWGVYDPYCDRLGEGSTLTEAQKVAKGLPSLNVRHKIKYPKGPRKGWKNSFKTSFCDIVWNPDREMWEAIRKGVKFAEGPTTRLCQKAITAARFNGEVELE